MCLPDSVDYPGMGTARDHNQSFAFDVGYQGLVVKNTVQAILVFPDRPKSFHCLQRLIALHLTRCGQAFRQERRTSGREKDGSRSFCLRPREGQAYVFQEGTDLKLGREDLGVSKDGNPPMHIPKNAHKTACVVIVAVAENDHVQISRIDLKESKVMQCNLRGSASVHENSHLLRPNINLQEEREAMLGPEPGIDLGVRVLHHHSDLQSLDHDIPIGWPELKCDCSLPLKRSLTQSGKH